MRRGAFATLTSWASILMLMSMVLWRGLCGGPRTENISHRTTPPSLLRTPVWLAPKRLGAWIGRRRLGLRIVRGVPWRPVPLLWMPPLRGPYALCPGISLKVTGWALKWHRSSCWHFRAVRVIMWCIDMCKTHFLLFHESLEDIKVGGREAGNVSQSSLCGWRTTFACLLPLANADLLIGLSFVMGHILVLRGKLRILLFRSTRSHRSSCFLYQPVVERVSVLYVHVR